MISMIVILDSSYNEIAEVARPDGDLDRVDLDTLVVHEFGLTSGGALYWDTAGASPGECPVLAFDRETSTITFDTGDD